MAAIQQLEHAAAVVQAGQAIAIGETQRLGPRASCSSASFAPQIEH